MPTPYESLKICMTKTRVDSCSIATQETGSELQSESEEGCLLSPILFNIFLERIMCEALDSYESSVSMATYYRLPLCIYHWRKCSRGRRSWCPSRPSRYKYHKVQNRDWSRQDESDDRGDDKQPKWLPKRNQDKRSETRVSGELQVPGISHL